MKFERVWSWNSVREVCIKCDWYTRGSNEAYNNMLGFVESHKPTDKNIEKVAIDIYRHSNNECGRTINDIAFVLGAEAVHLSLKEEEIEL